MRHLEDGPCSLHKNKFMKQTVFRYGIYGTLAGLALGAIQFFILIPRLGYEGAELTGYLTILPL